jgi:hypothetical protein
LRSGRRGGREERALYLQRLLPGASWHTPPMHCAKMSHVVLDPDDVHGCPSAMIVGHVGPVPASVDVNVVHEPTRQRVDCPSQGCPAAA